VCLLFLLLITQFLFFPQVEVGLSGGAMLFWPRVVCGSTAYCLAHLSASSQAVWAWATG
jgi:hypothetical protein